jgi:hypothetical protein
MRRQDEQRQWQSEQAARIEFEAWRRQQELAAETAASRFDGNAHGPDHLDDLVAAERDGELREYVVAYHGRFHEYQPLAELWERAAAGKEDYSDPFDSARRSFWDLVNSDQSEEASTVRRMLEAAGFELRGGDRAPMLKMEEFEVQREADVHRRQHTLTLSIDHLDPQSKARERTLDTENLRFMLLDDNALRGNRWTDEDNRREGYTPRESLTSAQRDYRERIEQESPQKAVADIDASAALFREQDRAREWRDQMARQQENAAINDYWWHPTQGFWAWMRRQDEQRQWQSEQAARIEFEAWRRQQELAAETASNLDALVTMEFGAWQNSREEHR